MQNLDLERKYGVVRFEGTVRFHKPEALVFQSDDAGEAMEHLEKECLNNGAMYHHGIIFKDGN